MMPMVVQLSSYYHAMKPPSALLFGEKEWKIMWGEWEMAAKYARNCQKVKREGISFQMINQ